MSENTNTTKRRSAIQIMGSLIGLVKPLLHIMLAAIILGTLGYLCAIFLTILTGNDYYSHDRNCSASWNPALCGTVL